MNTVVDYEQYRVEHDPSQGIDLGCMDYRAAQGFNHYFQTDGGLDNVGRTIAVSLEMQKTGGFTDLGYQVHELTGFAGNVLKSTGVDAFIHEDCKAFELNEKIDETLFANPEGVFDMATVLDRSGELTWNFFEQVIDAKARIRGLGRIASCSTAGTTLHEGFRLPTGLTEVPQDIEGRPFIPLEAPLLAADTLCITYDSHTVFDQRAAMADGNPAYHINADLRIISEKLSRRLPINPHTYNLIATVGQAATIIVLDQVRAQSGYDPLAIQQFNAA